MFEWYYVGQYGQLGPLSEEQMLELVDSRVILDETFVWKYGMKDWTRASTVPLFASRFAPAGPPPVPGTAPAPVLQSQAAGAGWTTGIQAAHLVSPCNRVLGGILQLIPGVGRMYLGYLAIGLLQFILAFCSCGLFAIWSLIDGVLILTGHVKIDGYGRVLE